MSARKSLLIRIDPRLHEELVAWAQQEFRSVNGQIEYLLRTAIARRRGKSAPAAGDESSDQDEMREGED